MQEYQEHVDNRKRQAQGYREARCHFQQAESPWMSWSPWGVVSFIPSLHSAGDVRSIIESTARFRLGN
ncbi:hypothetical protein [Saccharopolyspora aridisoli]|uniref:hypothetical protein n=1 Tax=Saccharopolyspora aridisoli TaxID=2530385 RepID=UPI0014052ADD|nr:hypothetical protein [Saccharopolyspora aridisoli]